MSTSRQLTTRARSPGRTSRMAPMEERVPDHIQAALVLHNSSTNLVRHSLNIMLSERSHFSEENMRLYRDGYEPEIRNVLSRITPSSITVEIEDAVINLLDLQQQFVTGTIDHDRFHRNYQKQIDCPASEC